MTFSVGRRMCTAAEGIELSHRRKVWPHLRRRRSKGGKISSWEREMGKFSRMGKFTNSDGEQRQGQSIGGEDTMHYPVLNGKLTLQRTVSESGFGVSVRSQDHPSGRVLVALGAHDSTPTVQCGTRSPMALFGGMLKHSKYPKEHISIHSTRQSWHRLCDQVDVSCTIRSSAAAMVSFRTCVLG